ncbi:MFS general substrate transporter [Amylocystis lapponica]|nr:MFS general substrate transporter [Amylocystis lapponica]
MSRSTDPSRAWHLRVDSPSKSRSRPGSRIRGSEQPLLPQGPEALINPDVPISEEVSELLQEFVHPHHHDHEATLVQTEGDQAPGGGDDVPDLNWTQDLPWWKKPSPWWFIYLTPLSSIAIAGTMATRVQIITQLACETYKPEYTIGRGNDTLPVVILAGLSPFVPLDDTKWALCAHDPVVQAAVARLSLVMTTAMGILGCLTTTWWGSLSDRYGRLRVLSFASVGGLLTDFNFIVVYRFAKSLPGGYWCLIVGPILEGFLGGMATTSAAINAYVADCTDSTSRARFFSLFVGLLFAGMSLGPTLGSLLIKFSGNLLSVFYVAFVMHVFSCCFVWFLVPESLSREQLAENREIHAEDLEKLKIARSGGGLLVFISRLFSFLAPVALFYPTVVEGSPLKKTKRDWNLLLLVLGHACVFTAFGGVSYKMQYATMMYGWTAEQLGYWTSLVGAARALHLIIILPVLIKIFNPPPPAIQLPVEPSESLTPSARSRSPYSKASEHPAHQARSAKFDLGLARRSTALEVVAYLLIIFAPTSGTVFVFSTILAAFGAGSGPAFSSLMPMMYAKRGGKELGKLFGAFGVIQAICSQILGPFLYGMTYLNTVSTFPSALFVVSAGTFGLSLALLACIRLQDPSEDVSLDVEDSVAAAVPPLQREDTLVDVQPVVVAEDEEHRATIVKP